MTNLLYTCVESKERAVTYIQAENAYINHIKWFSADNKHYLQMIAFLLQTESSAREIFGVIIITSN